MSHSSTDSKSIGTKLEKFYIALYVPPGKAISIDRIIECIHDLESHKPLNSFQETHEVVEEIVKDCRKKCSQQLRAPLAETIRNVIALSRKRLVSKAALDSETSSQHNQRHLQTLIELLGTWSNIVVQCVDYSFSRALTRHILFPLYTRIVEASVECFKTFKRDKELDQWGAKLLDDNVVCNVASLDFLVSQVAGMRELLHQHYSFLYHQFSSYDTDSPSTEVYPPGTVDSMLIVTTEELLHWRELDAVYVTMEFGFINRATQEALKETTLLEVEEHVYIPQCIEDIFFILSKVSYRALSTGSDSAVMGVANRVLETIRETIPNDFDKHSFLYRLVTNKHLFKRCVERNSISSSALAKILSGPKRVRSVAANSAVNSAFTSSHTTPHKATVNASSNSNMSTPTKSGLSRFTEPMFITATEESGLLSSMPGSPGIGLVNSISDLTSVSLTGMNWWLSDQLSPYISTAEAAEPTQNNGANNKIDCTTGGIAIHDYSPDNQHSSKGAHITARENKSEVSTIPTLPPPHGMSMSTPSKSSAPNSGAAGKHSPPVSHQSMNSLYGSTGSTGSTAPTSNNSALSLDEMLLNALVGEESHSDDAFYARTDSLSVSDFTNITTTYSAQCTSSANISTDYVEHCMYVDELRAKLTLCESDWVVQLNTLYTVAACTSSLRDVYSQGSSITDIYKPTSAKNNNNNPIDLIVQELNACALRYRSLLVEETKVFSRWIYTCYIELDWMKFCSKRFIISGEEMETRVAHSELHLILRKCFGITPLEKFELDQLDKQLLGNKQRVTITTSKGNNSEDRPEKNEIIPGNSHKSGEVQQLEEGSGKDGTFMRGSAARLSQGAYVIFLEELCNVLVSQLFEKLVFKAQFNEWGALLLHQEVISLSAYMEQLIDHLDPVHIRTVKATFDTMKLALNILTLDAPGDIRRYCIHSAQLSEEQVRAILGRRIDFSQEAVRNVKLNIC